MFIWKFMVSISLKDDRPESLIFMKILNEFRVIKVISKSIKKNNIKV